MSIEGRARPGREAFARAAATAPAKLSADGADAVRIESPPGHEGLPVVVRADQPGVELVSWANAHRQVLDEHLARAGAILFRRFEVRSAAEFRDFAASRIHHLLDYQERSTPRRRTGDENVYTSTEYPADQFIEQHNEMAYAHVWPRWIAFYCATAAATGGATPIADSRRVYQLLDPSVRDRFRELGVRYVRNYGTGVDLSWQDVFQTEERDQVERYCERAGIEVEWLPGDRLRTRQVRQAVVDHPVTGERVWFNSAHMFHVAGLGEGLGRSLSSVVDEADLPRQAFYGDGSPIEAETIRHIREVYRNSAVAFPWEDADVMVLDNMLTCHGRQSYTGVRKVLVAFGDPVRLAPGSEPGGGPVVPVDPAEIDVRAEA